MAEIKFIDEDKPKNFVLINLQDYYRTPTHLLTFLFRDGWTVIIDKQKQVAIFYR